MQKILFTLLFLLPTIFAHGSEATPSVAIKSKTMTTSIATESASKLLDPELFAAQPAMHSPQLSPSGKHIAAFVHASSDAILWINDVAGEEKAFLLSNSKWKSRWFTWISDTELVVGAHVAHTLNRTPLIVSRLIYVDILTRDVRLLFDKDKNEGFDQIQDSLIGTIENEPGRFLLEARKDFSQNTAVYKVNGDSRNLPSRRVQNSQRDVLGWSADRLGNVRAGYGFTKKQNKGVLRLKSSKGKWIDYSHLLESRDAEILAVPTHNLDSVYIQMFPYGESDNTQANRSVYELNVATGLEKRMFGRDDTEVSNLVLNPEGNKILAIKYNNEEIAQEILDPKWQQAQEVFDRLMPNTANTLIDASRNQEILLFAAEAPNIPRSYYIYKVAAKRIETLQMTYPDLVDVELGQVFSKTYTARDGLEIPVYLTLPAGLTPTTTNNIPFVVLPHGGPNARDFKRFDWLTQLFVSRGYGVLQMNFRGSTGYGVAFQRAGEKEWGQAMQDDITDGTHWLIEQGLADAEKVCIVGGSYGGYAALMGVMKEPDLYRCAVSFNGVSDLRLLLKQAERFIGGRFGTRHIGRLWKDRKMLKNNSPVNLVANLTAPLLIIHGEKDRVVNIRQSEKIAKKLAKEKPDLSEFVTLPNGDHFLSGYDNRITFAKKVTEFLQTHLGPEPSL